MGSCSMAYSAVAACLTAFFLTAAAASAVEQLEPTALAQYCAVSASNMQGCTPSLPGLELQVKCCTPFKLMQELECFCMPSTREFARSSISPDVWAALTECSLEGDINLDRGCHSAKQAVESDKTFESASKAKEETADQLASGNLAGPVLDLGNMLDPQSGATDMTVAFGVGGDLMVNFDVDLEEGEEVVLDLDFSNEISNETNAGLIMELDIEVDGDTQVSIGVDEDMVITWSELQQDDEIDIDIELSSGDVMGGSVMGSAVLDRLFSWVGVLPGSSGGVYYMSDASDSDGSVEIDLEFGEPGDAQQTPAFTIDVDVDLPEELKGALGDTDVTIEIDLDMDQVSQDLTHLSVSRAADGAAAGYLDSQDLGSVLRQASEWVASLLSARQAEQSADRYFDRNTQQVLEGVTQLLSQIGEEVGERVPGGQIEPGQSYTFDVQPSDLLREYFEAGDSSSLAILDSLAEAQGRDPKASRKSLDTLSATVSSSLFTSQAEVRGEYQQCQLCRWVHAHLGLLWGVVYANLALLLCCFILIATRYVRQPAHPAAGLEEPLIVNAAEFAEAMEHKSLLAPVWEPALKPYV